jgi:transcriptional regulator with XRE-family HTH domain
MYILRIRDLRLSKGFTQEFVSRELCIPNTSYRNLENNKYRKCDFDLLFKMRDFFGVSSVEDLFIKKQ